MMPVRHSPLLRLAEVTTRLSNLQSRLGDAQLSVLTGQKVHRPSDAPGGWSRLFALQRAMDGATQYKANADLALPILDTADQALASAVDTMIRANELAVQGASEVLNVEDRASIADEVDALLEQLVAVGNTEFAGRFLFGGTETRSPPFDISGAYVGNADLPETRLSENGWVQTGWSGGDVLGSSIAELSALSVALRSGDAAEVSGRLDSMAVSFDGLVAWQVDVGVAWQRAEDAGIAALNLGPVLQAQIDTLAAAEPTAALAELSALQVAYETALAVSGTVFDRSLFDFLK